MAFAQERGAAVRGKLELPIPQELRPLLMSAPHARVLVEIGEDGSLLDLMPYSATHRGLVDRAVEAVRKAKLVPAMRNGNPVSARVNVYVNFVDPEQEAWRLGYGLPQGGTVSEAAERRLYERAPERYAYGESDPRELDERLSLVRSTLRLYHSAEGVKQTGRCVVEYFVGPDGQVHFPRIISSDHEDLSLSALLTLEVTEFVPPTKDGHPTWVKVRQPFNFNP